MDKITGNGRVVLVELAHGFRVDMAVRHAASGEVRHYAPAHFATLENARKHAQTMAMVGSMTIEENLREPAK